MPGMGLSGLSNVICSMPYLRTDYLSANPFPESADSAPPIEKTAGNAIKSFDRIARRRKPG